MAYTVTPAMILTLSITSSTSTCSLFTLRMSIATNCNYCDHVFRNTFTYSSATPHHEISQLQAQFVLTQGCSRTSRSRIQRSCNARLTPSQTYANQQTHKLCFVWGTSTASGHPRKPLNDPLIRPLISRGVALRRRLFKFQWIQLCL